MIGRVAVASVALTLLTVGSKAGCAQSPSETVAAPSVTIQLLAAHPEAYVGQTVRLAGTLENEGKNYFTDLRVVLSDGEGHRVYVRPWLPTELPPGPKRPTSGGSTTPDTLSKYLGKTVELTARVDQGELQRVGSVYFLEVLSATQKPELE